MTKETVSFKEQLKRVENLVQSTLGYCRSHLEPKCTVKKFPPKMSVKGARWGFALTSILYSIKVVKI